MNKTIISRLIAAAFMTSLGFAATSAMAAQDTFQQQINQRLMQSQQKLQQAETAKGGGTSEAHG